MERITLIILLLTFHYRAVAQDAFPDFKTTLQSDSIPKISNEGLFEGFYLIRLASNAFCQKDTLKAIEQLSNYVEKFPKAGLLQSAQWVIGHLYLEMGNTEFAQKAFTTIFALKTDEVWLIKEDDSCQILLTELTYKEQLFDACLQLSKIAISEAKFDNAKNFVDMASKKYFPNTDCGNGYNMYFCRLTPYLADYNLSVKDTTEALKQCLISFFNYGGLEDVRIIRKIKKILSSKYTNRQIENEINKSIIHLKTEKSTDNLSTRLFGDLNVFNTSITLNASSDKDEVKFKNWIYDSLKILKE